ncbi:MAG TPA: alpha/beta hydrolase [Pyrinomonadaceae bacterium]
MTSPKFTNSYLVTNRADPTTIFTDSKTYVTPLPSGGLSYYLSDSEYDQDSGDYSSVPESDFMTPLQADLQNTAPASGPANLAVYIHGLAVDFDDAISSTAAFGAALASPGGYNGLLIGFDWPSYGELVGPLPSYYATSRPPQNTSGTIRDNINGSTEAFVNLMQALLALRINNQPLNLNIITHSEGNFMLLMGMMELQKANVSSGVNNALMLAADISAAMLQQGQLGDAITTICNQTTVYYSGCDPDLCFSDYEFFAFHDQAYPTRLGLIGPFAYPATAIPKTVVGIDCAQVTIDLGSQTDVHSSYRSLPQVLVDLSTTMNSTTPVYTGRKLYPGATVPSFYLDPSVNQMIGRTPQQSKYRRR